MKIILRNTFIYFSLNHAVSSQGLSLMDLDHSELSDQDIGDLFSDFDDFKFLTTEPSSTASYEYETTIVDVPPEVLENKYNIQEVDDGFGDYGNSEDNRDYENDYYDEDLVDEDSEVYYYYYDDYPAEEDDEADVDSVDTDTLDNGWTARRFKGKKPPPKKKQPAKKPAAPKPPPFDCFISQEMIDAENHHFLPFGPDADDQLIYREAKNSPVSFDYTQQIKFTEDTGFVLDFMGRQLTHMEIVQTYLGGFRFTKGQKFRSQLDRENLLFFSPFIATYHANSGNFKGAGTKIASRMFDSNPANGAMWLRVITKNNPTHLAELNLIKDDMIGDRNFKPSIAFILTVVDHPHARVINSPSTCPNAVNNYQTIIIGDSIGTSYTIANYGLMSWGGFSSNNRAGFSRSHDASRIISGSQSEWHYKFAQTNVAFPKRYVFDTSKFEVVNSQVTLDYNTKPKITYTDFELSYESSSENIQKILNFSNMVDSDFMVKNIQPHGCWCGKFLSNEAGFGGQVMDEVDNMCKQWHQCRACAKMKSCDNSHIEGPFTIRHDIEVSDELSDQFLCYEFSESRCGMDTCECDLHFARSVMKYLSKPLNSISGTLHHYKMLEECKPQEAVIVNQPIPNPADDLSRNDDIDAELGSDLVEALQDLNSNLNSLGQTQKVVVKKPKVSVNDMLFNPGTGEDDNLQGALETVEEVIIHPNDECCGEAPLWQPYSTMVHECRNNRICLLGQCPYQIGRGLALSGVPDEIEIED